MKRGSSVGVCLLVLGMFVCAASAHDDSHYVSLGPRNGYYIVEPDSKLFSRLGLYEAPVIDTADPLRHGYGADALAFRFNRNGVLIAPPAYIAQALPYDFYRQRLGSLTVGGATVQDVEAFLAGAILAQIARMVLCGITRCRFIIRSRNGAAAVDRSHRREGASPITQTMRLAICLAAILAASVSVMADAVRITSPDHAQTFAYGEMISHQLYFDRTSGELAARITSVIHLTPTAMSHAAMNRSTFVSTCPIRFRATCILRQERP